MGRTACTEPQCLYKGALYLYLLPLLGIKRPGRQADCWNPSSAMVNISQSNFFTLPHLVWAWWLSEYWKNSSFIYCATHRHAPSNRLITEEHLLSGWLLFTYSRIFMVQNSHYVFHFVHFETQCSIKIWWRHWYVYNFQEFEKVLSCKFGTEFVIK